ncbi:MAG: glucose-1-phosphate adenylyltransferase, partial [Verrucomicrobiota bacterium]|nr:glucose-1-phosphate adenylyltransferase [Verrucomicrobiota bacterium]
SVIYTRMRYLPPSKINHCNLSRCLLSDGCIISGEHIDHAVIGLRALVGEGSVVEDSILMGADYYEHAGVEHPSRIPMGIGENCIVKNAIIDKNVRIGNNVVISPVGKPADEQTDLYWIRDGIMVIPKNTVIPSGTVL